MYPFKSDMAKTRLKTKKSGLVFFWNGDRLFYEIYAHEAYANASYALAVARLLSHFHFKMP